LTGRAEQITNLRDLAISSGHLAMISSGISMFAGPGRLQLIVYGFAFIYTTMVGIAEIH